MHTVVAELVSGSIRTIREKPAWWMVRSTSVRPCFAPCSGSPTWCRLRLQLASNTPRGRAAARSSGVRCSASLPIPANLVGLPPSARARNDAGPRRSPQSTRARRAVPGFFCGRREPGCQTFTALRLTTLTISSRASSAENGFSSTGRPAAARKRSTSAPNPTPVMKMKRRAWAGSICATRV